MKKVTTCWRRKKISNSEFMASFFDDYKHLTKREKMVATSAVKAFVKKAEKEKVSIP